MYNLQAVATPLQTVPQQPNTQEANDTGPVLTAGVLPRLNSTMRVRKMVTDLRPKIFIAPNCQLRNW